MLLGDPNNTEVQIVKLADFGISRVIEDNTRDENGFDDNWNTGSSISSPYLPPELVSDGPSYFLDKTNPSTMYSIAGDVWSLCMTFYFLCTLQTPNADNFYEASKSSNAKLFPKMPSQISAEFQEILLSGLKFE